MPFEPGNQLAAKRKQFEGALRRALAQDSADRLRRACERLLDSAAEGATWAERIAALQFLADRLDGRVLPQMVGETDGTLVVSWVMNAAAPQQAEVIDATSTERAGSHPANAVGQGPHAAIENEAGVGGGGGTPLHTSQVPVPVRSDGTDQ